MDMNLLPFWACCLLLGRVGLMLFEAGVSRSKNAASSVLRVFCDFAIATLAFCVIGQVILLQQDNGFFGFSLEQLSDTLNEGNVGAIICLPMVLLATGQIVGAFGERGRFFVVGLLSAVTAGLLIPIIWHWTAVYGGVLKDWGAMDVGGALGLHLASGTAGLVAAGVIGARTGKHNKDGSVNGLPGHNVVLMTAGMMLLIVAWLIYLGMAAEISLHEHSEWAILGGVLAAAAGAIAGMFYSRARYGKVEVLLTLLASLGGLAAISAGAGLLEPWKCAVLGAIGGMAACWFTVLMDVRGRIDEASGLASTVAAGAVISVIGSPLLAMDWHALWVNTVGMVVTVLLAAILTAGTLWLAGRFGKLRVGEDEEYDGLDLSEHDVNAYPDFQQTMIRSYHQRQM
jgi:Amt family ammonium transporter